MRAQQGNNAGLSEQELAEVRSQKTKLARERAVAARERIKMRKEEKAKQQQKQKENNPFLPRSQQPAAEEKGKGPPRPRAAPRGNIEA